MALFHKKKAVIYPVVSDEQILALREYVNWQLNADKKEREQKEKEKLEREKKAENQRRSEIRYSLSTPSYNDAGVNDMLRFLDEAKKDSAMFSHPALKKTYHQWEKKTAVHKTFSSEMMRMLDERKIRPADFYKEAQIDKRVFHSMKKDYMYKPSKDTAFRCCAVLKLSFTEASEMLKLAGYSLSPSDSRELVLRFCLENKVYDIYSINSFLNAMGERELR